MNFIRNHWKLIVVALVVYAVFFKHCDCEH
jgi:hypothetical protein